MTKNIPIAYAEGDGIGPEIMAETLKILKAANAPLEYIQVEVGEKVYLQGEETGISEKSWKTIRDTEAFLKAPITTPQGGGFRSLNVTIRGKLGLYANVRPCASYYPYIETKHPEMDIVVIRENEEDLYTGIEYRQSQDVVHALKVNSRPGSEKIIRYAFEYARANGRKKVTCFTKDNILKMSDGLFHKVFDEVAKEYEDIENEHWIIDIGTAKVAANPELFDVLVLPNLYGDIISDVTAQITGSVGLAGSANIGDHGAMFEAIHGSAPKRAGENMANPSGLLLGAVQMLLYLGMPQVAETIHNAWLKTIEDGIHTYDIYKQGTSKELVKTDAFGDAIVKRLGQVPKHLKAVEYNHKERFSGVPTHSAHQEKETVGVDVFIDHTGNLEELLEQLEKVKSDKWQLQMVANRGVQVWPNPMPETFCVDSWRCRFMFQNERDPHQTVIELLRALAEYKMDFTHTENLCTFDGAAGFSTREGK
ncbi:MAG: NADP-dependent isocitrate dehydrogenase [Waddliaceae bacterium]